MADLIDDLESVAFHAILAVDRAQSALAAQGRLLSMSDLQIARPAPRISDQWYSIVETSVQTRRAPVGAVDSGDATRKTLLGCAAFFARQGDDLERALKVVWLTSRITDLVTHARHESACVTDAFLYASEADNPVAALDEVLTTWELSGDGEVSATGSSAAPDPVDPEAPSADRLCQMSPRLRWRPTVAWLDEDPSDTSPPPRSDRRRWWEPESEPHIADSVKVRAQFVELSRFLGSQPVEEPMPFRVKSSRRLLVGNLEEPVVPRIPVFIDSNPEALDSSLAVPAASGQVWIWATTALSSVHYAYGLYFVDCRPTRLAPVVSCGPRHQTMIAHRAHSAGRSHLRDGRVGDAIRCFRDALNVSRAAVDDFGTAAALAGIAQTARRLGQNDEAALAEKELCLLLGSVASATPLAGAGFDVAAISSSDFRVHVEGDSGCLTEC